MMCDDFGPAEELSLDRRAFKAGKELIETVIYQMEMWEGPFFVVKRREHDGTVIVTYVDILTFDLNDKKGETEVTTTVYRRSTWWDRMWNNAHLYNYIGDFKVTEVNRVTAKVVLDADLIAKMREAYQRWEQDEAKIRETVTNRNEAQKRLDAARQINRII